MARFDGAPGARTDAVVAALLGATFLVVVLLLAQAVAAVRAHRANVTATLDDYAGFAAERVAAELDATFSSIFLDQITESRSAHYAWISGSGDGAATVDASSLPPGAIRFHFTVDGDRLVPLGGTVPPDVAEWTVAAVAEHSVGVYPAPAPYAVLRAPPRLGPLAVVYRKEQAYERRSVYGFVVDFGALDPIYARALDQVQVLPRSWTGQATAWELVSVRLILPQGDQEVHARAAPAATGPPSARAFAPKAGRMLVRVDLDGARARALLAGGYPGPRVSTLGALSLLTVALLTVALALLRRASRLNGLREDFVANVSHELRTPLAQIRMFSETLLLDRVEAPEERRRALGIIRREAGNLAALVDNILHATRDRGAVLEPRPVDVAHLLEETLEALEPLAQARSARVEHSVAGAATASVDPVAFRRIVVNLLDNALKYGPEGQTVRVSVRHEGARLEVRVDDQGPGIPRGDRTRVWQRFARVVDESRAVAGTGLGLAVVRDLAERHGGRAAVTDAPGGGTRVTVSVATGSPS